MAFRFVKKYGFPVCVKPNVSGFSRGSYFPINSYTDLLKAIVLVKIWWPGSVIEQYLEGKNYRVVVVKDEIMSAIRRYPPFIIGDGRSNIGDLIDKENKIRRQMALGPVIHSIQKSFGIARFLKSKKLSFSSIPLKEKWVPLYNRISLAPGGVIETLDKKSIHEQNRNLFLKILPSFNANFLGIDAIFEKGIDIPYTDQRVIFLEVNSRPYLKMHDYPRYGEKQDLLHFYDVLNTLEIQQKDICTNQYNRQNEPRHTMSYGWDLIRKGRSHTALDVFAEIANYNLASGGPKLGYAIAAADSGQLSKSVWAMRRVLFLPNIVQ